ncbi:hypothetical protein B0T14DRAFT_508771, partial [Immersiella caudata]
MDSSNIILSDSESTNALTDTEMGASSSNTTSYKATAYNSPDFILKEPPNTGIYIFDNGLYTRILQPLDNNIERKILIKCVLCSFSKITPLKGFKSSNYVQHYQNKHPTVAYNKATEKNKTKIQNIPSKNDFFSTSLSTADSRKRSRNNTITDFNDHKAYDKILNFIIENNLSFNILESSTFKELLSYYNRLIPIINRKKIKTILEKHYHTEFLNLINDIRLNIEI